jgi:hypothetical protein
VGVIALLWRRQPRKQVLVFAAVAAAAAGPWYARTWILAGNPLYSLRFGGFAVNPIHDALMQYYNASLGVERWPGSTWISLLWFFLAFATLPLLAGIPGACQRFRQHGYFMVSALLLCAVWMQSVGYTSAGVERSTRVLSPVIVVLSITGAGLLEPWTRRARWHMAILVAIVLCQVSTAAQGVLYPNNPFALPLSQWPQAALQSVPPPAEFQLRDQLAGVLPAGSRVLSDNAYLHAALLDKGIQVVPVWSPEVRFIFSLPPEESERRLRSLGIACVVYYPASLNTGYLVSASPFYASLPQRWRVLAQIPGVFSVLVAPQP